jgi:hypothetical protein
LTEKRLYVVSPTNLPHIRAALGELQIGDQVRVGPPDRLLAQSAKFHAMCGDIAKQKQFAGRTLKAEQWKVILISAHSVETGNGADLITGLAGEIVNIRESSAAMSIARMASLIEYVACWGAENNVTFKERHY